MILSQAAAAAAARTEKIKRQQDPRGGEGVLRGARRVRKAQKTQIEMETWLWTRGEDGNDLRQDSWRWLWQRRGSWRGESGGESAACVCYSVCHNSKLKPKLLLLTNWQRVTCFHLACQSCHVAVQANRWQYHWLINKAKRSQLMAYMASERAS